MRVLPTTDLAPVHLPMSHPSLLYSRSLVGSAVQENSIVFQNRKAKWKFLALSSLKLSTKSLSHSSSTCQVEIAASVHGAAVGIKWDDVCKVAGIQSALNTSWSPSLLSSAAAHTLAPGDYTPSISCHLGLWRLAFFDLFLEAAAVMCWHSSPDFTLLPNPQQQFSSLSALLTLPRRAEEDHAGFDNCLVGTSAKGIYQEQGLDAIWKWVRQHPESWWWGGHPDSGQPRLMGLGALLEPVCPSVGCPARVTQVGSIYSGGSGWLISLRAKSSPVFDYWISPVPSEIQRI